MKPLHLPPLRHLALKIGVTSIILASTATCWAHASVTPISYFSAVEQASASATISIKLDRLPDLFTQDDFKRQADSLQIWIDTKSDNPIGNAYSGLFGDAPATSQTLISFRSLPSTNTLDVIWIAPLSESGERDTGGWGRVKNALNYSLSDDNVLSFCIPLNMLNGNGNSPFFYYSFFSSSYGAASGDIFSGVSQKMYSPAFPNTPLVPEPELPGMLLCGLGVVALNQLRGKKREL